MKTVKPMKLGILTRCFERDRKCYFSVGILGFFRFGDPSTLESEVAMWKLLPEELGSEPVDVGMPKLGGELLVKGSAFAPGGEATTTCPVRVRLGGLQKQLHVIGDRTWSGSRQSAPRSFVEMPISWEKAYGGEGFATNPLGKGYGPIETETGPIHPLPNVELPGKLVTSPRQRPEPAGFRSIDYTWPQRFSKLGTYDSEWIQEGQPGFAKDIDWTVWNAAPPDQRQVEPFVGDERFAVENMHPTRQRIEGRLPGVRARCFVTRSTDDGERFEEVDTRLTTVWLLPHAECGVLVFHGSIRIQEDDGRDVMNLLLAAESLGEARPTSHYSAVLEERLDKEKGALASLREDDLLPSTRDGGFHSILDGIDDPAKDIARSRHLLEKNMARRARAIAEERRTLIAERGLDPDEYAPLPEPAPSPPEDPALLVEFMNEQREKAKALEAAATERREAAKRELRELCEKRGLSYDDYVDPPRTGPPSFSAEGKIQEIEAAIEQGRAQGADVEPLTKMLGDPRFVERLRNHELGVYDGYRRTVHQDRPAAVSAEASAAKRRWVVEVLENGGSLQGVDLTGADLSGLDLSERDLRATFLEGVNLEGASLRGADLRRAVLAHAQLGGADLSGANLAEANLGSADLAEAIVCDGDLRETILAKSRLTGANLSGCTLDRADFTEADLDGVCFDRACGKQVTWVRVDLAGGSFADAKLEGCNFLETTLEGCNFERASLQGCVFYEARAARARFVGAQLENARFVMSCSLEDADLQDANLERANLRGSALARANLSRAVLRGADLSEVDLEEANLSLVSAEGVQLVRANLRGAKLIGANLMGASFLKSDLRSADLRAANLFGADFARVLSDSRTSVQGANQKRSRTRPRRNP